MKRQKYNAFIFLIFVLVAASSCNKNKTITYVIHGEVFDPNYNKPVQGTEVTLYAKEIKNNTYSNTYNLITSTVTDSEGAYAIDFERSNVIDYKLSFSNENYFNQEMLLLQEDLSTEEENPIDVDLIPKAFIKFVVQNQNPFDETDVIEVYFDKSTTYNCPDCCGAINYKFLGSNVDTTANCATWANKNLDIQYVVTKNGGFSVNNKTVFTNIMDTAVVTISY